MPVSEAPQHWSFEELFVDVRAPGWASRAREQLNDVGLVTFDGAQDPAELARLGDALGEVLVQDDTDPRGIKTVAPQAAMAGSHLHTDRTSMRRPPNVVIIGCARQSDHGGESILADGASLYARLAAEHPQTLAAFETPQTICFGMDGYRALGALFEPPLRSDDEDDADPSRRIIRFRYDRWGFYSSALVPHLPVLLRTIEQETWSFRLRDGQGYIAQNGRWLHGASPGRGGARHICRVIVHAHGVAMGFGV